MHEKYDHFSTPSRVDRVVRVTANSDQGREGIIIVKTTQAILIAHYGENAIAGNAATTVEQLGDYLIKSGY